MDTLTSLLRSIHYFMPVCLSVLLPLCAQNAKTHVQLPVLLLTYPMQFMIQQYLNVGNSHVAMQKSVGAKGNFPHYLSLVQHTGTGCI